MNTDARWGFHVIYRSRIALHGGAPREAGLPGA